MFLNVNNNSKNKAVLRLLSNSKGIVILEYAVVAMIGLPLLLLLLDVGNVLRIKASLQESVKRTLRCLTPLEADCVDNLEEEGIPLYEAEINNATNRWPLPEYFYALNKEGLFGTTHQFSNPIARILDRVSYERKDVEYLITERKERLKVNLDYYVKTTTLPYIDTGSNSATTLNPKFLYRKSLDANYPGEVLDISSVIGTVKNLTQNDAPFNKLIGSISFTVPSVSNLPCFNSRNIDIKTTSHESNFKQSCNINQIPTVLYITGKFPVDGLAEGSRGRIKLNLKGKGIQINGQTSNFKTFNLGARAFTYDSKNPLDANFVPRGAPIANVSNVNNFEEFELYKNIHLQAGETYTLDFYLQRTTEAATRTGWQGQKLKLFYGQQQRVKEEHYCEPQNILIQGSGASAIKTCQYLEVREQVIPRSILTNLSIDFQNYTRSTGCIAPEKKFEIECSECRIEPVKLNSCLQTKQITNPCPSNFGTKLDPNSTSFAEAEKICPIKDPQKVAGTKQVYYERDLVLPDVTLNYEQQSCSEALTPKLADYPESVRNYQKVTWKKGAVSVGKQIDTKGIKPSKFKIDNPEMNCAAFQVKNKKYDFNNSSSGIPRSLSSSMLVGAHSELITGCNWEESVADEAREKLGLDQFDYLDVSRELAGYEYLDEKPELSCYGYLPQKEIAVGDIDGTKNLGPFTKDQIPDICQDPSVSCQIKLVGFQGGGGDDFKWNESLAVKKGYEALKAAYSGAKINCERTDPNCFNMDINFDGKRFDVYASMELPLLSLLGKKQIKLNFRSQGIYQGALLDSGR